MYGKYVRIFFLLMVVYSTGIIIPINIACAIEFNHGAALRQNMQLFRRPDGMDE